MITLNRKLIPVSSPSTKPDVTKLQMAQAFFATAGLGSIGIGILGAKHNCMSTETSNRFKFAGNVGLIVASLPNVYNVLLGTDGSVFFKNMVSSLLNNGKA